MKGYVQRNPFAPKAQWWKKYEQNHSLGKIVMYVATPKIGYTLDFVKTGFSVVALVNGKLQGVSDNIEYVNITEIQNNVIVPTKALKLNKTLYMFNPETSNLEVEDIAEEDIEIITVNTTTITYFNKNFYVKKQLFNATEESEQQEGSYQPISGLLVDSSHITLKTQNFAPNEDMPKNGDIITYDNKNWAVEETTKGFIYTPKKKLILHIALKLIG